MRLLARLCSGRHLRRLSSIRFQGAEQSDDRCDASCGKRIRPIVSSWANSECKGQSSVFAIRTSRSKTSHFPWDSVTLPISGMRFGVGPEARPTNSGAFRSRARQLTSKAFRSTDRRRTRNENRWCDAWRASRSSSSTGPLFSSGPKSSRSWPNPTFNGLRECASMSLDITPIGDLRINQFLDQLRLLILRSIIEHYSVNPHDRAGAGCGVDPRWRRSSPAARIWRLRCFRSQGPR